MLRSSLGFHTMTLSLPLENYEVQKLIHHFKQYSKKTGLIQMYHVDKQGNYTEYKPTTNNEYILPTNLKIKYHKEDFGIKWQIRCNNWSGEFRSYQVEATINPKILAGIHDYLTAAIYDDMNNAITNFNLEANRISPLLKGFDDYKINRLDYCINFCLDELAPGCSYEQIMNLIKRGDIPSRYSEWKKYDDTAHRMKSRPGSFYLTNDSVVINCYSKYMKLLDQDSLNAENGYPPISQSTLNAARSIIRFEVQCKYHKIYSLSKDAEMYGNHDINKYKSLLNHVTCIDEIDYYYKKIIRKGDWYTLQEASRIIKSQNFNKQKEKRLIDALHLVNQCRSLAKAKTAYRNSQLDGFEHTLKDLDCLLINPVTIPKEWGIKHIPNLLYAYFDAVQKALTEKQIESLLMGCLKSHKYKRTNKYKNK